MTVIKFSQAKEYLRSLLNNFINLFYLVRQAKKQPGDTIKKKR